MTRSCYTHLRRNLQGMCRYRMVEQRKGRPGIEDPRDRTAYWRKAA